MLDRYPAEDQIRHRAYQIYLERGAVFGHEIDDWLQAEYELMQLPIRKIAKLHPIERKKRVVHTPSLVALVQTALFIGAEALPRLRG